jgi:hypothetical protein
MLALLQADLKTEDPTLLKQLNGTLEVRGRAARAC